MKLNRFFPIALVILCVPLCLLLLWMWVIYAGSVLFWSYEPLGVTVRRAFLSSNSNPMYAVRLVQDLLGTLGGLVGWISLVALVVVARRPWSRIPKAIKAGCAVGVVSAAAMPVAPGLGLPPVLLCGSLAWLAIRREADSRVA